MQLDLLSCFMHPVFRVVLPMLCRIAFLWSKLWSLGSADINNEPGSQCWVLDIRHTTLWLSCRETEVSDLKRFSVCKQLSENLRMIAFWIFRTFPSPQVNFALFKLYFPIVLTVCFFFFSPNLSCFTSLTILWSFHSSNWFLAYSSLGKHERIFSQFTSLPNINTKNRKKREI